MFFLTILYKVRPQTLQCVYFLLSRFNLFLYQHNPYYQDRINSDKILCVLTAI